MTPHAQVPADERLAALIHCMGFHSPGGSGETRLLSSAPERVPASISAWDTILVVQAEVDDAGRHIRLACRAVVGWFLRDEPTLPPPHDDRRGAGDVERPF
jgi:hypothetical protein